MAGIGRYARVFFFVWTTIILVSTGAHRLWSQAIYGSIYGQITDATGAALPGATVTITDVSKGTSVSATTNSNGEYVVEHLIPDTYDVTVAASGFRTSQNKGILISADTSPKVNLKLEIGEATETVQVTSEAPQLKTDRADVAQVFNEQTVSNLPIADRNFSSLELLIPGAQTMTAYSQDSAENPQGSAEVQINGQSFSGVAYELDGANNQDPILGQIVINPPLDAVTEAKITAQDYDAEFGQAVAAVVTSQTKSGTNSFHGDIFDYRRSDAQQARNPFVQYAPNTITGRWIPVALYSQPGGSIGGPILKQKIFFFGDYQEVRSKVGSSSLVTVPTTLMHTSCLSGDGCDLSEYLSSSIGRGPAQGQIYNPRVLDPITGQPAPFPNNFIAPQYLSSQALALLALIPTPTSSGIAQNYAGSGTGISNNDQFDVRVDDQISQRTHAFGRYSYFSDKESSNTIFGAAGGVGYLAASAGDVRPYGGTAKGRNQNAVAGMDIAVRPALLTDFRLGYLRYHVRTSKFDDTDPMATNVGIPGLNLDNSFTGGAPAFYITSASGTGLGGTSGTPGDGLANFGSGLNVNNCNCSLLETEDQYQVVNNWTKLLGSHSIKWGVDLRYARNLRVPSDTNRAGELYFNGADTEDSQLSSPGGLGLATFLLGDVTGFGRFVSSNTNAKESQKRIFAYGQDTWRVTANLTLNYGVRWEIYFPETANGKGNGGLADLNTGNIDVAGYGPFNTAMNVSKNFRTIAPRLGVAYQVDPKTVVRAGYGRSFSIGVFGSIFGHVVSETLPVLANQSLVSSGANTSAFNLATGPTAFTFPTVSANGTIPIPNGLDVDLRHDPLIFPTVDAWNLTVQRQLNTSTSVSIAYVGNKGTHTFADTNPNTNPNEAAACLPARESITGQPICWNPAPTNSNQTSNVNQLQPYYAKFGWTQGLTYYHNGFDSHYNALQITGEKRISQGLQFTASYAWQRAFNYGSDYAEIDKVVSYGRYDDLREQQFTFFGNYDLPFGRDRLIGREVPFWMNYIIGGYKLNGVVNWSGGLPFTPSYGECGTDIPDGPCMPNKTGARLPLGLTSYNTTSHTRTYFVPGAEFGTNGSTSGVFTRPNIDQYGSVGRNNYFGPSFFNSDLSIIKDFSLKEGVHAQFRADAFNAFNHINPANPASDCIDCTVANDAGVITGMAVGASPRQLEFSLRLSF